MIARVTALLLLVALVPSVAAAPHVAAASEVVATGATGVDDWVYQRPYPTPEYLGDVQFLDASTGWVVGSGGTIVKTTDGGVSWMRQLPGSTAIFESVHFVDVNTGWAVGYDGIVFHTKNSGTTWSAQASGTNNDLRSVHFMDASTGWAVGFGGTILKTTNGGRTWAAQASGTSEDLLSVQFMDAKTGWAVGVSGGILKTTNGGINWTTQTSGTTERLVSTHFLDEATGWAVGDTILKTTNGGIDWVTQIPRTTRRVRSIYFSDSDIGWALTNGTDILRTVDGGQTWTSHSSSGKLGHAQGAHFMDAETAWAVGDQGIICKTTDGGATWALLSSATGLADRGELHATHFVDAATGWAVGVVGNILKTTDGGETWTAQSSGTTDWLYDVHFVDENTGWAVGVDGIILKTTTGGASWVRQASGTNRILLSVHFVDQSTGWAVGRDVILKTANGGATWVQQVPYTPDYWLESVQFIDHNVGWAVGADGIILKTSNGGATWSAQDSGTMWWLHDLHFLDADTGWAVGIYGVILKTTDGGQTWTWKPSASSWWRNLKSVQFVDADNGWAVGERGGILKTTDGGESWSAHGGALTDLTSVHLIDAHTGWAVGRRGAILSFRVLPHAADDSFGMISGVPFEVSAPGVLANDTDPGGSLLTAELAFGARNGEVALSSDGSFTYTPDEGFSGTDTFYYRSRGEKQLSHVATVTIVVKGPDVPLPSVIPIAGLGRYDTAIETARKAFPNGADTVVIATGENWPDALGGTALAGAVEGPVLLVQKNAVPSQVMSYIEKELKAKKVIILGGHGAVSKDVESALKAKLGKDSVDRIAGSNRYDTANRIATRVKQEMGSEFSGYAFVATGGNFPDALAAAPLAAAQGWPLYLADPKTGLSEATKAAMGGVTDVVILGGTGAVGSSAESYLIGRYGKKVTRLQGANRYETAVKVATYAVEKHGHTWNRVGITTGANFPDALAGGVLQGNVGSVMVLTEPTSLNGYTKKALTSNKTAISTVTYFGGTGAISGAVRTQVADALK